MHTTDCVLKIKVRFSKPIAICLFSFVSLNIYSQTDYNADTHFSSLYQSINAKFHFSGKTKTDYENWRSHFLPELKHQLGLQIIEKQLAAYKPKAELKESEEKNGYTLQKWFLWTEPYVPIPFVVLIPKTKLNKLPMVMLVHGHGRDSILYDGIYPRVYAADGAADETLIMQAMKEGYIAIAPTIRAFGTTRFADDVKAGNSFSCHTQLMRDLLTGRTVIGDRVWDVSKLLDWAIENLPVDTKKIAITGNSGGGTVSLFSAACDNRITLAVPSSYFCTFTGSIGSIAHCDCNYIPGILSLSEMSDIAGLIAPRCFRALHGVKDEIYPITETRKAFADLKKIYVAAGSANNAELYEGAAGHQYYKEGSWVFIRKHFSKN
jgi:hypothetical protein